jgi:hypothetical protein
MELPLHGVQLTADEEATLLKDIEYPEEMPSLFKGNLGKSGLVFPPSHPYYNGLPDDVKTDRRIIKTLWPVTASMILYVQT